MNINSFKIVSKHLKLVSDQTNSGLNCYDFALTHSINYRTFCKWRAKIRPGNCDFNQTWHDIYYGKLTIESFKDKEMQQNNSNISITLFRLKDNTSRLF